MSYPAAFLEGPRHCGHALVHDSILTFMPCPRLMPWPDSRAPAPWGSDQTHIDQLAKSIASVWAELEPERRCLDPIGGLARCCNRQFPGGGPTPTQADILLGLFHGTFACWQDVALLAPLARKLGIIGMRPAVVWFDAENWPDANDHSYSDVAEIWHRSTGRPVDQMPAVARQCLNSSARTVCDALGWCDARVVTVEARNDTAAHWWSVHDVDADSTAATYCHIDPALSPDDFAHEMSIAAEKCCAGVFIFGEDVTAEQLESHRAALSAWSN